jgi:hypothetical protein
VLDNLLPQDFDEVMYVIKLCSHLELFVKDSDSAKEVYFNAFLSKAMKRSIPCKAQFLISSNHLFEKFKAKRQVLNHLQEAEFIFNLPKNEKFDLSKFQTFISKLGNIKKLQLTGNSEEIISLPGKEAALI